uniref:non-specific serine/threonine protein kinase n=1 Tax=Brassica campestris TaxID=3711 RepID=A0A3P5Z9S3_BRACM|nr:unnamed protein product [Brassica rapa]
MEKKLFTSLLLFTMFSGISFAGITTESPLSIGQTLSSSNEIYELGFFSPPDNSQNQYVGIWFKGIIPRVVVWVANREKPVTDSTAHLAININGSLLLLDGKHGVVWSTRESSASNRSRAELSDEGNLIVTDNVSGRRLWESFENLGDTLLPFSPLTYNLATGEKRVLTSWKSYTDPSLGDVVAHITPQVPSQLFTMRGSTPYYRTGPWAKTRFSGIPLMDETLASPFSFQQDANGSGSFSYVDRSSKLSRLLITSEGTLMRFRHIGTEWEVSYQAPANPCDVYGVCGPFGLCIMSDSPKCKCFKGFVPKFPEEWNRGNWTNGCVRRTELDCQGNSTGEDVNVFHPVANIKPPDFYTFVSSVDAKDCYQICLHNCSCLAFAHIRGIGCLIWNQELIDVMQFYAGGELLSIRLARSELASQSRYCITMVLFACSLLLIVFPSCGYAAINTSSPLSIGQTLSSPGGFYELGFFSPNNTRNLYVGIWFKEIVPRNLGDTMVPQSSLMYDLSLGKKRVLTSWKSNSDPSPGGFSLEITPQPEHSCDLYGACGPFGLCVRSSTPKCICVKGFFLSNGETLSLRLARSELGKYSGSSRTKIIVGAITSLSIVAILIFTAFMFWRYRGKQNGETQKNLAFLFSLSQYFPQDISGVNFFQMHTIRTATDNFSSSNKLGQGGFGPVYKGILLDGKEIAVKRLSSSSGQGTEEFMNEITLISKLQHRNLVRLLGYCIEREEKLLIYEFMVNKSLDIFLFDPTLKLEIDWPKRFNIIQGIARGLLYLHRDSCLRVIHRDLKVSNILLDEEMNPKISDFGLARMFQGTQFQYSTQRVAGTLGYMSPEYAWAGLFSEKSDIYSFGVLMLEIISGEKISRFTFGDERKGLVAYAWESWCESGGFTFLDRDLNHSCKAFEVARCVQLGLLCVQHEAADRPNTLQVMSMITSTTDLPIPKQPIFAVQTQNVETSNDGSMSKDLFSVNDLTHSVIQGR